MKSSSPQELRLLVGEELKKFFFMSVSDARTERSEKKSDSLEWCNNFERSFWGQISGLNFWCVSQQNKKKRKKNRRISNRLCSEKKNDNEERSYDYDW